MARAIMLDEYGSDPEAALEALDLAQSRFGDDPILVRARAKVFFRRSNHTEALALIRGVAEVAEINNPTERTFMLREAAICAAETGAWVEAQRWFGRAKAASAFSAGFSENGMTIGLQADEALAAYKAGDLKAALQGLNSALDELRSVKPDLSIAAGYRHRVIRHAVLWLYGMVTGTSIDIDGKPSAMLPGMCSNPEPSDLGELPLGSIEYARYLLANAEVAGNVEAGIDANLRRHLDGRSIAGMEIGLRHARLARSIMNLDHADFAVRLTSFVEACIYLESHEDTLRTQGPLDPSFDEIPRITAAAARLPEAIRTAEDAVLIFGIMACVSDSIETIDLLCESLDESHPLPEAGRLASAMADGQVETDRFEVWVASQVNAVSARKLVPDELFLATVRFAQTAKRSSLGKVLALPLSDWVKRTWMAVLGDQQFNLRNPAATVPSIKGVLESSGNDLGFVGRLIIDAQPAVHHRFDQNFRDYLKTLGG